MNSSYNKDNKDIGGKAVVNESMSDDSVSKSARVDNTAQNRTANDSTGIDIAKVNAQTVITAKLDGLSDKIAGKVVRLIRGSKRGFTQCKATFNRIVGRKLFHSTARVQTANSKHSTNRSARRVTSNPIGIHAASPAVVISVILLAAIITTSIVSVSSRKTEAQLLPNSTGYYNEDVTRIEAPTFNAVETDSDTYTEENPPESSTAVINDCLELILPAVTTASPASESTDDPLAVTDPALTETTVPETLADTVPETVLETVPETVPETIPETTAAVAETLPPVVEANPAPTISSGNLLVDKYNIEYDIVKPTVSVSDEEVKLTAAIIQLEVMGNGSELESFDDTTLKYWEMLAVAMCIRNRAESSHFPDTIKEVILDSVTIDGRTYYQFSPATALDTCTPTDEALAAAREVLCDGVTVLADNYYYFCASSIENRFEQNNSYSLIKTDTGYAKVRGDTTTFYAGFYND